MDTAPEHPPDREDAEAEQRDVAADARDLAATARDVLSADAAEPAVRDRAHAARDRLEAARDRAEWTARADAAAARDVAAARRDAEAAGVEGQQQADDRGHAAEDRAAAAHDRHEAALDRSGAADVLRLAYRDDLTGLLLRDAGREQLLQALDRSRRAGEPLTLAFLDVDGLKQLNDTRGHAAGDQLLAVVGNALRQGLRSYDVLVRWGGDEFVCALAGTSLQDAGKRLAGVTTAVADALPGASLSTGLAELSPGEDLTQLLARADTDMYARRAERRSAS